MSLISAKLLRRRPQELGKIKIGCLGAERTSSGGKQFRLPVKLDHFILTSRTRGKDGNFVIDEAAHANPLVGKEPTELAGVLMYETPEENFHAELVQYSGRTKIWTCNGEEATNLKSGVCGACPRLEGKDCKCKPYSRLTLQLWTDPMLGYRVFRTTSWESTANIQSALQEIYERFGTCFNAPVKLVVYPAEDRYEEGGKEKTSESWKVGLVLAVSMEDAAHRMVEAKRTMQLARTELRLLSAGVQAEQEQRDVEEADAIAEEFFPDRALQASVETQGRLEDMKAELGVGMPPTTEDQEPDAAVATAVHLHQLRQLREEAREASILPPDEEEAVEEVLSSKDDPGVRMWIAELKNRLVHAPSQKQLAV